MQTDRHGRIEATSSHYYSVSTRWDGTKRVQLSAIEYAPCASVCIGLNVLTEYYVEVLGIRFVQKLSRDLYRQSNAPILERRVCVPGFCNSDISRVLLLLFILYVCNRICMSRILRRIMRIENYSHNFQYKNIHVRSERIIYIIYSENVSYKSELRSDKYKESSEYIIIEQNKNVYKF